MKYFDKLRSTALCMAATSACLWLSPAQAQSAATNRQLWPAIELALHLPENTDLQLMARKIREQEADIVSKVETGFLLTHRLDDPVSVGAGYRYAYAPGSDTFRESRLFFEQTLHFDLPIEVQLGLRTGEELRWIEGSFSMRLRQRARIERRLRIGEYGFVSYGTAEIYYDTRYDALSRGEIHLGAVFPVTDWLSFDLYGARQENWNPSQNRVHALGLAVALKF